MNDVIIACTGVHKTYTDGSSKVHVLKGVDFSIQRGARIAIIGPSGSGKSTLLHLLGGLDKPSSGKVLQKGVDWQSLSERQRCQKRNKELGFVYQFHHLLPEFSALENVMMPLCLGNQSVLEAKKSAEDILIQVGLQARMHHKPSELSGGERQRVAIARALVHHPDCVFADEPTGNLDNDTAHHVFQRMLALNQQYNTALVIVTHDQQLAASMDVVFKVSDGLLVSQ